MRRNSWKIPLLSKKIIIINHSTSNYSHYIGPPYLQHEMEAYKVMSFHSKTQPRDQIVVKIN